MMNVHAFNEDLILQMQAVKANHNLLGEVDVTVLVDEQGYVSDNGSHQLHYALLIPKPKESK